MSASLSVVAFLGMRDTQTCLTIEFGKRHPSGALKLHDAISGEQFFKVVELVGMTVEADGDRLQADGQDLALEDRCQFDHLAAVLRVDPYCRQQQLALDGTTRVELADLDHLDQLEQLLGDLLERRGIDIDNDGDAAEARLLRGSHREGEDVVVASREQSGDAGQHTRPVLHEHRQDVMVHLGAHWRALFLLIWESGRIRSSLPMPAGTIGKTFSRALTRKSTTTGRSSIELALSMAGCTSSGESTRMPTQPIASAHLTKSGSSGER